MNNTVHHGDCLTVLKTFPDRNSKGQFLKGTHWRKRKPFWDKEWLEIEYIVKGRSSTDIANEYGVGDTAIHFWLKKHGIPTRTISEARKIKRWGLTGNKNGMYGKTGKLNPHWNGGHSPERQTIYARHQWKEIAKDVLRRDRYTCRHCGVTHTGHNKLNVHHLKHWSKYPELRFDKENLITLCQSCHKEQHRR